MEIKFKLRTIKAIDLPKTVWPSQDLKLEERAVYGYELETLRQVVIEMEQSPDPLLLQIFAPFRSEQVIELPFVVTAGAPAALETWTTKLEGVWTVFFNLSAWTVSELKQRGRNALLSEVVRWLMRPLLMGNHSEEIDRELELFFLKEGLASFIGCPVPRETLLLGHSEKWEAARLQLQRFRLNLVGPLLSYEDKWELLNEGLQGPFWERFISVHGLFGVAQIFDVSGVIGLQEAIKLKKLL